MHLQASTLNKVHLMTLKLLSTAPSADMPDTVYLVLHFDSIVSIRDTGVEVLNNVPTWEKGNIILILTNKT